ncbi:MAG: carboxylating nicotinate-nucleotide diphosphorylase, partial [Candidatus Binatia bacterium]
SLAEDLGPGDITTLSTVDAGLAARAQIRTREDCVLAGLAVFDPLVAAMIARAKPDEEAASLKLTESAGDGSRVVAGEIVGTIAGTARALLMIERTLLNLIGRLSGVATMTARFVDAVASVGASTRILDTRKTAPGHRVLEKYAVRCGGGANHRTGLFDAILIKDNHIVAAGSIEQAVLRARAAAPPDIKIEVECDSRSQVEEALEAGARSILIDNFAPDVVREIVELVGDRARVEVSGGVTLETVARYASVGPDDISVGSLTHSARSVDLSMAITAVGPGAVA